MDSLERFKEKKLLATSITKTEVIFKQQLFPWKQFTSKKKNCLFLYETSFIQLRSSSSNITALEKCLEHIYNFEHDILPHFIMLLSGKWEYYYLFKLITLFHLKFT